MDEHRHLWCVVLDDLGLFERVGCRCGLHVIDPATWRDIDQEAAAQFVDPDGVQRQFMAASGL